MSEGKDTVAEKISFSPEFQKARQRLTYFSAIGILIILFPFKNSLTLLGITFENLSASSLVNIFSVLTAVIFIDLLSKMIEEGPLIFRNYRDSVTRYRMAEKRFVDAKAGISYGVKAWQDQCNYVKKLCDSLRKEVDFNGSQLTRDKLIELIDNKFSAIESQMYARTEEMKLITPILNKLYRPSFFPGIMGYVRVLIEYFSGLVAYVIFVACFWASKTLPVLLGSKLGFY